MPFDFPTFLVAATALTGGIWLADAVFFAPRRQRLATAAGAATADAAAAPAVPKEPVLVEYARAFFPVILVVLLLRSFVVEPFRIPSGSMMPTLLVGDFILVNKYDYGLRLPVTHTLIWRRGQPERGDVAVFRFPQQESVDYIKRVVGIPGDQIYYRNKTLYINGEPLPQTPLGTYTGDDDGDGPVPAGLARGGLLEMTETINGREHSILVNPRTGDFPPTCRVLADGPITVPEGHFFMVGDNRDNSNDSRCWGFVPERNLVGKAFVIWMHWNSARPGLPIAFDRLGDLIQ